MRIRQMTSILAVAGSAILIVGCDTRKESSITTKETEQTESQIQAYERKGTEAQKIEVEQSFTELDKEIQELETRVNETTGDARAEAQAKLDALKDRKTDLRLDFTEAKFKVLLQDIKDAASSLKPKDSESKTEEKKETK
jgi:nitrogenase subunit NifH